MNDNAEKGTRKGKPNYKSATLLKVIRFILTASKAEWEEVATDYQAATSENGVRGYQDVKHYFIKKMIIPTRIVVNDDQKQQTQVEPIFVLHSSAWLMVKFSMVCDLLVFYKTATNMLQTCYKFWICKGGHDHLYKRITFSNL